MPERCCGEVTSRRCGQAAFNEKAERTSVFTFWRLLYLSYSGVGAGSTHAFRLGSRLFITCPRAVQRIHGGASLDQTEPWRDRPSDGSENQEIRNALVRGAGIVSTSLTCRTHDNSFFIVVSWNTGSVGEYHGNFNGDRLSGVAFDRTHPQSQATWFVDKDFQYMW